MTNVINLSGFDKITGCYLLEEVRDFSLIIPAGLSHTREERGAGTGSGRLINFAQTKYQGKREMRSSV